MICVGCGMSGDDWTPGCRSCVSRHYKRALRSHDPEAIISYRRTARAHTDAAIQERARRQRDGESHADMYARRRSGADGEFPFRRAVTA